VDVGGLERQRRRRAEGPAAVFGNLDRDRLVAGRVEVLENGGRGRDGDFVLSGTAAEDDADAQFFHVMTNV
jgi:hypothetical protein